MQERFETFTVLIAKISRAIRKIKTEEISEYNLKSPHVSCLYSLHKYNSLTAKELCDLCGEDKAQISRSIEYLEKNGFLYCESHLKKRYNSQLLLTEKGEKVAEILVQKIDKILDLASRGLSEEHRLIMYSSLSLISKNLDLLSDNHKGE